MPSYDFVCQDCGAPFEVRLSMSAYEAGEGRVCTQCGSTRVERTFTPVNVIAGLHGGGHSHGSGGCCRGSGFT
jgi:putative FmdB family regulatory protein